MNNTFTKEQKRYYISDEDLVRWVVNYSAKTDRPRNVIVRKAIEELRDRIEAGGDWNITK